VGIYFVIKHADGTTWHPPGVSATPHLFASEKKALVRLNSLGKHHYYFKSKVVPVLLSTI